MKNAYNKSKIKTYAKKLLAIIKRHYILSIIIALIIFPVIIDLIYAISTKQIVNISAGDLLSFYGAALGIFVSFVTYR